MKINLDGIKSEDKQLAINVLNYIKAGNRVIGDPGEGLRQTLAELENKRDSRVFGKSDWEMKDPELESQISKTKAGIKGEEDLCDYLTRLIKYNDKLEGVVAFASLAYKFEDKNKANYVQSLENAKLLNTLVTSDIVNLSYSNGMKITVSTEDYFENETEIKSMSPSEVSANYAIDVETPPPPTQQPEKDYIPDTDTLLVYGNHILVVDAKNLKVKPGQSLMLLNGCVVDADKGKEIIEVHPSTHIWEEVMKSAGIQLDSIDGYVCIVNDLPADIIRTDEWYESHTKLIHISELQTILEEWVKDKDNRLSLKMLTEISKAQIKKKKDISFDIDSIKRKFGV